MKKAFTLVEILIVVIILGILAAMVIPKLSTASNAARESMLLDDVRVMRSQMQVFKWQHYDVSAGYPNLDPTQTPTEAAFIAHMTMSTTQDGDTAEPGTDGYSCGPYLRSIAENPINGKNTVQMIADDVAFPESADDSHGWVYKPATLEFAADATGADQYGKPFFDF